MQFSRPLLGLANTAGVRIYCYHGVTRQLRDGVLERNMLLWRDFEAQLRFLRRFRVISLDELMEELVVPNRRLRRAAVITFDDGYVNTLLAAECLNKYRLPWTIFVSTNAIGPGRTTWLMELSLLLLHGRCASVELLGQHWPLTSRPCRLNAFECIRKAVKRMPSAERQDAMQSMRHQFPEDETARLLSVFPDLACLSWKQIAELVVNGAAVGSHGVDHELHHARQPDEVCRKEMLVSRKTIEEHLHRPCQSFAFPNGDTTEASATHLRTTGYRCGLRIQPAAVQQGSNPLLLPRLATDGNLFTFGCNFLLQPGSQFGRLFSRFYLSQARRFGLKDINVESRHTS